MARHRTYSIAFKSLLRDYRRGVTAKGRPSFFPKLLYKTRTRIKQAMGKLKRFKRIALREDSGKLCRLVGFTCGLFLVNPSTGPSSLSE